MRCSKRQQITALTTSAIVCLGLATPATLATAATGTPTEDSAPTATSEPSTPSEPDSTETTPGTPTDEPTTPPTIPTDEPTSTPTDEPTTPPTGIPTHEPTMPPTGKPTGPPDGQPDPPPPSHPSTPPTDTPDGPAAPPEAPTEDGEQVPSADVPENPDQAYDEALEGAQTVAVAEAQRLLAQVLGEQSEAQRTLAAAVTAAGQARLADETAQQQLEMAQKSLDRTKREIDDLAVRTQTTRDTLGAVAREAYKGNGLATLGVVLAAETPAELTDRYIGARTLLRTGDSALGQIATDEAELRNAHAQLGGQRAEFQAQADVASKARVAKEAAEKAARAAQDVVEDKSDLVEAALQAAEDAKLEDYRRYIELLDESTAIGNELAGATDYGPGYGTGTFVRPGTGQTTSEYGPRLHPILGYVKIHTGLDFGRGDGKIYAADAGTVIEAKWNNAYGNMVIVDHGMFNGNRLTTMYAHQPNLMVDVGQRVTKGQVIGNIGSTGYSTGPHLHFEVRLDGQHTNPWPWVKDAPLPS